MSSKNNREMNPAELITGTRGGISNLFAQAKTEGLIPEDMSILEFANLTRSSREQLGKSHLQKEEVEEQRASKMRIANLFKRN